MNIFVSILITAFILATSSLIQNVFADAPAQPVQLDNKYKNVNINIVKSDYEDAKDDRSRSHILSNLEKYSADNKDVLFFLGDAYSRISGVPKDAPKAIGNYTKAAELGNLWALVRLGDLYNDATLVPRDSELAFSYYKTAADKGLSFAKLRLGNAYLNGTGVSADIGIGLRLIKESADTGDKWALMKLGDLYRWGDYVAADGIAAAGFYQKAASAGNADALIRLAEIYRDGAIVPVDAQKSISYFEQAAKQDTKRAIVLLGQNHIWKKFGPLSDPEHGLSLLIQADKAGEPSAAPALANLYMNGNLVPQDPQRAIDILTKAAEENNKPAITLLVSYYRDGKNVALPKDIKKAQDIFQKYQAAYEPVERIRQEIMLKAASARSVEDYTHIGDLLKTAPAAIQTETMSGLYDVNANVFVAVVQERLKQRGLYDGKINGLLSIETIHAINNLCKQSVSARKCAQGPFSPPAIRLVTVLLQ